MSRTFAITGAFGVLGAAVAVAFVQAGHRTALIDFAATPSPALVQACGADNHYIGGVDLADGLQARAAIDQAATVLGGLAGLINVAGGFAWQTLEAGDPATWEHLYRMNVLTAANACRAAIPHLKASSAGRIVNIGARGALNAAAGMGAYAASKAGVHSLTQSLAEELKPDKITVNAVLPSIIDTPANRADMPNADFAAWVSPGELAAAILFLASESASGITGALLPVSGRV